MVDRTHRELTGEEVARIADTYHAWRVTEEGNGYADVPGFCKSASLDEVRKHGHVLTPGRYVGVEPQKDDGEPFEEKMIRLVLGASRTARQGRSARRHDHREPSGAGTLETVAGMYDIPDITPFKRAIQRLEEGLERYRKDTSDLQIRDGLIQRFEFTYELGCNTLKRYLEYTAANPALLDQMTFQDQIRTANEHGTSARGVARVARLSKDARHDESHLQRGHRTDSGCGHSRIPRRGGLSQGPAEGMAGMTGPAPKVDLRPDHWAIVRDALRRHVPDREVLAFGSRATWTAKEYSDLDLAVMGEEPLSLRTAAALDEELGDSDLPFKVDVVDWARIDDSFREIIRRNAVAVQNPIEVGDATRSVGIVHVCSEGQEWTQKPLGQVIELKRGYDLPTRKRSPGPVPVVSSSGITGSHRVGKVLGPGVVTGRYGTLGNVYYILDDFWPLNTALYVRDFKGNDPRFVSYLLRGLDFSGHSDKAAVPGLNRNHLHEEPVHIPTDVGEQRAIGHILGTLDDKIELNRRMNKTLEAIARALFKSWFVDFDPVLAKMEGRDTGLPRDIADLFPDRLVDSEIGRVPEGWEVFRLDELTHHHTRSTSPFRSPELEYDHFSIPAYDAGQHPAVAPGAAIKSNKTVVPEDAVLLSKLNPRITRVWVPPDSTGRPQVCSTEFLAFTPKPPANRSLLSALFADQHFRALLKSMVTGTSKSHQRVPPRALKTQVVLAGSRKPFAVFGEATGSMLDRILKNRSEAAILAALRDTLLPKLISGEIRIGRSAARTEDLRLG